MPSGTIISATQNSAREGAFAPERMIMADSLLSFSILDDDADRRNVNLFFDGAVTPAALAAYATAYEPLLDAVIDGQIIEASYTVILTLAGGLKAAPVAQSEVQKGANFSYANASRYAHGIWVPSFKPTLFVGDTVNLAGAGVGAYNTAHITGIAGTAPTNGLGFDLTSLKKATKNFRK